jgi:hypothetical protein
MLDVLCCNARPTERVCGWRSLQALSSQTSFTGCHDRVHPDPMTVGLSQSTIPPQVVSNPNAEASCGCGSSFAPKG